MIEINKKYAITVDPYCFILNEIGKDKNGKKILKQLTYHSTLRGLINTMAKREIRAKDQNSFKSLEKKLCDVEKMVKKCKDIDIDDIKKEYFELKDSMVERGKSIARKKESSK